MVAPDSGRASLSPYAPILTTSIRYTTKGDHLFRGRYEHAIDEKGRVLAQIVAINGKLILREEVRAARVQNLDEIRAYLEANS